MNAKLKWAIISSRYRQWEIAQRMGVSDASLSYWVTGRRNPPPEMRKKLCRVLGLRVSDLFPEDKDERSKS